MSYPSLSTLLAFLSISFLGVSHPDQGELLCFEVTNYDIGRVYINDRATALFPFTNCGHDTVEILQIIRNNDPGQRPFGWDGKLYQKKILPGQKDTLRFNREYYHQNDGLYDQSFKIVFKNSDVLQYLNVFCELEHNAGQLKVAPVQLNKVDRGDTIYFDLPISNVGDDPVKISPKYFRQTQYLNYLDDYPIEIMPNTEVILKMQLPTVDLCQSYKKHISFYANQETEKARNTLHIAFSGQLNTFNEPIIEFDSLVLTKFINERDPCIYHFPFTNTGDAPLVIAYAKTSCGCLVASYPKEPIQPGERAEISVKYDSRRIGPINKSITVRTNACQETTVLRVKGYVKKNE